jgi:hypothetical protein
MKLRELKIGKVYRGTAIYVNNIIANLIVQYTGLAHDNVGEISFVWNTLDQTMEYRYYGGISMEYSELTEGSTTWEEYFSRVLQFEYDHGLLLKSTQQQVEHFPIY